MFDVRRSTFSPAAWASRIDLPMDAAFSTPFAAFVAGLVTSVHCAAMCGPLGCALLGRRESSPQQVRVSTALYHAARIVSYALIGGILGAVGQGAAGIFGAAISRALPWAMALLFVAMAFGLDRTVPQPRFVSRFLLRMNLRAVTADPRKSATALGLATPFLPCGPLYLAFGVALVAGSFAAGATLLAAFALGTIPIYALAQAGLFRWQARMSPGGVQCLQRGLALVSALIIGGRALLAEGKLTEPIRCLLCP